MHVASQETQVRQAETSPPGAPHVEVILNAAAGADGGDDLREMVADAFAACGVEVRVSAARDGREAFELARRAVEGGARIVVAGGGDGTVNAVASLLVGTDCTLGVLPLGTLNHFAKDLGIPLDLWAAARVVCRGRVARVDAAEVNGRVFVNNSSLGLYPRIVRRRRRMQERLGSGKWAAFFWAALAVLRRNPFLRVRLQADGREIVRETPFVFVGNNEYEIESWQIGARTRLDAGLLSLYVTHRKGRLGLAWLAARALLGRLREAKDFDALRASEVVVETHRAGKRLPVAADGEVALMNSPLHYRALPGALRVAVPEAVNREP